jgi:cephalosporin hydroxylase
MKFSEEIVFRVKAQKENKILLDQSANFLEATIASKYSYNFSCLGRPIIQYPQDMIQMQELIWTVKPDLIIETGIAHGGSLILSASMLAMLDYCEAVENKQPLDPTKTKRRVLGIDIDIRKHNRAAIEAHPMSHLIDMIEGSSISEEVVSQVHEIAHEHETVLVILDSNHTNDHVLAELQAYAPLTSKNSYCIVFDTVIEDLPDTMFPDRPWSKGDNPKTAVWKYLKDLTDDPVNGLDGLPLNFEIDKQIEHKLLITVAPDGYLRRI